jgi:hypothetical protein
VIYALSIHVEGVRSRKEPRETEAERRDRMSPRPVAYKATAELMVDTIDAGTKPDLRVTSVPVRIEKRPLLTIQK